MSDTKEPKLALQGADPKLPFYITGDLWADDSIDIESEGKDPLSLDDALERAKDIVEEHGGAMYVIECRAIRKVTRRSVRVETLKPATTRRAP